MGRQNEKITWLLELDAFAVSEDVLLLQFERMIFFSFAVKNVLLLQLERKSVFLLHLKGYFAFAV